MDDLMDDDVFLASLERVLVGADSPNRAEVEHLRQVVAASRVVRPLPRPRRHLPSWTARAAVIVALAAATTAAVGISSPGPIGRSFGGHHAPSVERATSAAIAQLRKAVASGNRTAILRADAELRRALAALPEAQRATFVMEASAVFEQARIALADPSTTTPGAADQPAPGTSPTPSNVDPGTSSPPAVGPSGEPTPAPASTDTTAPASPATTEPPVTDPPGVDPQPTSPTTQPPATDSPGVDPTPTTGPPPPLGDQSAGE